MMNDYLQAQRGVCPICGVEDVWKKKRKDDLNVSLIECPNCRRFEITRFAVEDIEEVRKNKTGDENLLPYLSQHTRRTDEGGVIGQISNDNWRVLASAARDTIT
jgi:Zn-finger nucleic acid-binding protein